MYGGTNVRYTDRPAAARIADFSDAALLDSLTKARAKRAEVETNGPTPLHYWTDSDQKYLDTLEAEAAHRALRGQPPVTTPVADKSAVPVKVAVQVHFYRDIVVDVTNTDLSEAVRQAVEEIQRTEIGDVYAESVDYRIVDVDGDTSEETGWIEAY